MPTRFSEEIVPEPNKPSYKHTLQKYINSESVRRSCFHAEPPCLFLRAGICPPSVLCPVGKDGKGPGAWPRGSVVLCGVSAAGSPPGAATSACGSLLLSCCRAPLLSALAVLVLVPSPRWIIRLSEFMLGR